MTRSTMRLAVLLTLPLLLTSCSGVTRLDFTSWGRAIWQRPEDVVRVLGLSPGGRVADIGAGKGYFVPYLSDAVGESGRVYAVEVASELTQAMENRFADASNVEVVLGSPEDPLLPDGQIDLLLIVNTYHHIENRHLYFRRLLADLAPEGRVAVIEPDAELTGILGLVVKDGHVSRASEVKREMRELGYRRLESIDLLPTQIFEVFGKAF
jgi:ubiquinone/menaquinone biosynthesis C-methylase UbiE